MGGQRFKAQVIVASEQHSFAHSCFATKTLEELVVVVPSQSCIPQDQEDLG